MDESETERLRNLEAKLHERVVGQDEAVAAVARTIRRGRVGLRDPERPVGSFLFLGPTGVGKTELCRALAEAVYGSESAMDLAPVAHLAAIAGRVPFVNFFDGFRTSHELQKVAVWDYADLAGLLDRDAVAAFRARALNPNRPVMRGSHENGDIFFQNREASNGCYDALPAVVEASMARINAKLGTDYRLFNYCGAPDADRVLVAMPDPSQHRKKYLTLFQIKV